MRKILYVTGKAILTIILAVLSISMTCYLFVPTYDFGNPEPFTGDSIYNPYRGADLSVQKRAILHFHTTRSDGKDEPEKIVRAYRHMGYDIISISDHHKVTLTGIAPERELYTYEHGLNAYRFHSVVFGVGEPSMFILPLWHTLSHRYETLRRLDEDFDMVVLNHPGTVRRLTPRQMKQLSHYQYIEADGSMDEDMPSPWDVALSAGHYSFVMANDDLHDLSKPYAIGRAMTFIITDSVDAPSVMGALEKGYSYALRVWHPSQNRDSVYLPKLTRIYFAGDTISVAFSEPAEIRFIGQDGQIKKLERAVTDAFYRFMDDDTYIRVEARFDMAGRTIIYLNPLARYTPPAERPANASYATPDKTMSVIMIAAHASLMALCIVCIFLLWGKKHKHDYDVYNPNAR